MRPKKPGYKVNLYKLLDSFLIRKIARELFGLPPLSGKEGGK